MLGPPHGAAPRSLRHPPRRFRRPRGATRAIWPAGPPRWLRSRAGCDRHQRWSTSLARGSAGTSSNTRNTPVATSKNWLHSTSVRPEYGSIQLTRWADAVATTAKYPSRTSSQRRGKRARVRDMCAIFGTGSFAMRLGSFKSKAARTQTESFCGNHDLPSVRRTPILADHLPQFLESH